MWSARERTIISRTKQCLEERKTIKVDIEELETLLGPDDIDVDFRRILEEARVEKGAICSKPSAQMVRVSSWWSVVRDGTSTKGSGTHLGDKIRLLL